MNFEGDGTAYFEVRLTVKWNGMECLRNATKSSDGRLCSDLYSGGTGFKSRLRYRLYWLSGSKISQSLYANAKMVLKMGTTVSLQRACPLIIHVNLCF
jgi:hypothetical protein